MHGDECVSEPDEIERRIDAAVRSYADPKETPEARVVVARVLERARTMEAARHRVWVWGWAGATACLLVMLAAGMIWIMRGPQGAEIAWVPKAPGLVQVEIPSTVLNTKTRRVAQPRSAQREAAFGVRQMPTAATKHLPKLTVFPTPTPLSPQEQALVAFATHGPPAVQRAVLEDQKHWDDPIIVADLRHGPLESGTQQDQ
jgi:hypothetical protein